MEQPKTTAQQKTPEQIVFEKIQQNRESGLRNLEDKIKNFDVRELVNKDNPVTEGMLRDIEGSVRSIYMVLEAINNIINMVIHDLPNISSQIDRLSTDGFSKEKVEMLVDKLKEIGIKCHRTNENRIMIDTKGIPAFLSIIGNILNPKSIVM